MVSLPSDPWEWSGNSTLDYRKLVVNDTKLAYVITIMFVVMTVMLIAAGNSACSVNDYCSL